MGYLDKNDVDNGQAIKVKNIINHPKFQANKKNFHNDIALLVLEESIKFTHQISPVCLPEKQSTNQASDILISETILEVIC